jgi:OmpA-OmpF porin, OOP family
MKMKALAFSCVAMLGLPALAQAHEEVDNSGKVSLFFGGGQYYHTDRSETGGKEIGLGYIVDKHWAIEALYSDIGDTGAGADESMYRLDGLYHFDAKGHWIPYVVGGVGRLAIDNDGAEDDDATIFNLGAGIKYALSNALSIRADVRAVYGDGDNNDHFDALGTIGFTYVFDAQAAEQPVVAASEAVFEPIRIELDVLFDTNRDNIKPAAMIEIERVAQFMQQHQGVVAVLEGHTDNVGTVAYNQDLSQRRADAVRSILIAGGIDDQRITATGYGEENPRATNDTPQGRQINRRVEAVLDSEAK